MQIRDPVDILGPRPVGSRGSLIRVQDRAPILPTKLIFSLQPPATTDSSDLLERGVVIPVPVQDRFQGCYSNLFIVPKKGGVCPVLDLRALNCFVKVQGFRMASICSVVTTLQPGDFLASLDIRDAYLHVPICTKHQKLLRFVVGEDHY